MSNLLFLVAIGIAVMMCAGAICAVGSMVRPALMPWAFAFLAGGAILYCLGFIPMVMLRASLACASMPIESALAQEVVCRP